MKKILLLFVILLFQELSSQKIKKDYPLSKEIEETSGLEIVDDLLVTHNDSGGEASLYYLSKKGKIINKRKIKSATNKDWEDITRDDKYIYVGDFGNNFSNRKDLKIFKVPLKSKSCLLYTSPSPRDS